MERLKKGVSIIVFPQSTRSSVFDERHFNSIGVKLARRAGVPIVPLALKTDAWGQGKKIKELGPVKAGMTVRYRFARPICVQGQGKEEHTAICNYISKHPGHSGRNGTASTADLSTAPAEKFSVAAA